jgi:hypothetical protein
MMKQKSRGRTGAKTSGQNLWSDEQGLAAEKLRLFSNVAVRAGVLCTRQADKKRRGEGEIA